MGRHTRSYGPAARRSRRSNAYRWNTTRSNLALLRRLWKRQNSKYPNPVPAADQPQAIARRLKRA